jgi:hypothetical protein
MLAGPALSYGWLYMQRLNAGACRAGEPAATHSWSMRVEKLPPRVTCTYTRRGRPPLIETHDAPAVTTAIIVVLTGFALTIVALLKPRDRVMPGPLPPLPVKLRD